MLTKFSSITPRVKNIGPKDLISWDSQPEITSYRLYRDSHLLATVESNRSITIDHASGTYRIEFDSWQNSSDLIRTRQLKNYNYDLTANLSVTDPLYRYSNVSFSKIAGLYVPTFRKTYQTFKRKYKDYMSVENRFFDLDATILAEFQATFYNTGYQLTISLTPSFEFPNYNDFNLTAQPILFNFNIT